MRKLDDILSKRPWLAHAFLFDAENGLVFRSQPQRMSEPDFFAERQRLAKMVGGWFAFEGKTMLEGLTRRLVRLRGSPITRNGPAPRLSKDRVVMGGISLEPDYLSETFFPKMLEELIAYKLGEEGGNPLAMIVYPADSERSRAPRLRLRMGGQA